MWVIEVPDVRYRCLLIGVATAIAVGALVVLVTDESDTKPAAEAPLGGTGGDRPEDGTEGDGDQSALPPSEEGRTLGRDLGPGWSLLPNVQPAKLLPDPDPPVSAQVLDPVVNGWIVGNHHGTTTVDAGLSGDDPSTTKGRIVIWRSRFSRHHPPRTRTTIVDVPGAGALRITDAPLGREVARWAPRQAELRFTSRNGITGTLDLKDDSVTLD